MVLILVIADGANIHYLPVVVVVFALIFAINSSIHSFLVVKYAAADKVAVSVGFYYMSNAMGRLVGTIGSGILYTYVGEYLGPLAGNDAVAGMAACFLAGTICSFLAVVITQRIDDHAAGLKCGPCLTLRQAVQQVDDEVPDTPTDDVADRNKGNKDVQFRDGSETSPTEHLVSDSEAEEEAKEFWA